MITNVVLAMGSLLIASGIALVAYQIIRPAAVSSESPPPAESMMPVAIGKKLKIEARSPYPGIVMIAFGTALLLAAQLAVTIRG